MKLFQRKAKGASIATQGVGSEAGIERRNLVVGAGVAGAAAVAAYSLRTGGVAAPALPVAAATPEAGDGYQLSQHVLRYYETAKV
jgi:hypothetical protein